VFIHEDHAFGVSIAVDDLAHPAIVAEKEIIPACQNGHDRVGRLCLGSNHAAVVRAVAAKEAARAGYFVRVCISLAQVSRRQRVRMITHLHGRLMEKAHGVRCCQWRRRVFVLARALEYIAAIHKLPAQVTGFAANPHQLFGAPVIILEFVVGDAPILNGPIRR
jgi:hypothetical protein